MDEMVTMLQRIRTLAVQSSNGTNSAADRDAIQQEVTQLSNEITRISCQTKFGGEKIMSGITNAADVGLIKKDGSITFQVGAYSGDTLKVTGLSNGFTMSGIASQAGVQQFTANNAVNNEGIIMSTAGAARFAVSTQEDATKSITGVDKLIGAIDKQRAKLGAIQNRMESTIRNQSNISMNVSDARSRIRDTDFAEESAKLSQQSIIQQAASSMLTQANARPQFALSMLG